MRGITEKELEEILNETKNISDKNIKIGAEVLIRVLLNRCKELNPLRPIDMAPKHKRVLLYYPKLATFAEGNFNTQENRWDTDLDDAIEKAIGTPTHWVELPEPPK